MSRHIDVPACRRRGCGHRAGAHERYTNNPYCAVETCDCQGYLRPRLWDAIAPSWWHDVVETAMGRRV